jgi:hypothetical protein
MELTKIFNVGGKPGLQKLIAQSKNGVIVESLIDKKRFNVPTSAKISSVEDITVFAQEGDKPLKEILLTIGDKNKFGIIEVPEESKLKAEFKKYLPSYDEDRVYTSDIKKIFKWYNLLIETDILKKEEAAPIEKKASAKKDTEAEVPAADKKPKAAKVTTKAPAAKVSAKPQAKKATSIIAKKKAG